MYYNPCEYCDSLNPSGCPVDPCICVHDQKDTDKEYWLKEREDYDKNM